MDSHITDASVEQSSASTDISQEMDELTRLIEDNGASLTTSGQAVGHVEQAVAEINAVATTTRFSCFHSLPKYSAHVWFGRILAR